MHGKSTHLVRPFHQNPQSSPWESFSTGWHCFLHPVLTMHGMFSKCIVQVIIILLVSMTHIFSNGQQYRIQERDNSRIIQLGLKLDLTLYWLWSPKKFICLFKTHFSHIWSKRCWRTCCYVDSVCSPCLSAAMSGIVSMLCLKVNLLANSGELRVIYILWN